MRIECLDLIAFGPFTDRRLDFTREGRGLQVVYGLNEAGKSAALRGLKALLYGFEERTADAFQHLPSALRVGGQLRGQGGETLQLVRRKGRKRTLLSATGEPLEEALLLPFLQGVSRELFETLFGFDHAGLVQGGRSILEQKGVVGQALFSAALGSRALHRVLADLEGEADALFRPRASNPSINQALKRFQTLQREIGEGSLSSAQWEGQQRELEQTAEDLERLQGELVARRERLRHLQRMERALPWLARRGLALQGLEALGAAVALPADFAQRRRDAEELHGQARLMEEEARSRLKRLAAQESAIEVDAGLMELTEGVEALHARLGGYRAAQRDRPQLEAERQRALGEARALLAEVRPDLQWEGVERLRPLLARRSRIETLAAEYVALMERSDQGGAAVQGVKVRLQAALERRRGLPAAPDLVPLQRAMADARRAGDLEGLVATLSGEQATLLAECVDVAQQLGREASELHTLPALAVPLRESMEPFVEAYEALGRAQKQVQEGQRTASEEWREAQLSLEELQRIGDLPSEAQLVAARIARDRLWQQLRRVGSGEDEGAALPFAALAEQFESALEVSDTLADRLRREADRVHELAARERRRDGFAQQKASLAEERERLVAEEGRLEREWRALWSDSGVEPRTPREMRGWLERWERLCERIQQLKSVERKLGQAQRLRSEHQAGLERELARLEPDAPGATHLEGTLERCEVICRAGEERVREQAQLDTEIAALERDLHRLEVERQGATEALEGWWVRWREALSDLGLPKDRVPEELAGHIEKVGQLFALRGEAEKLALRISVIEQEINDFDGKVAAAVAQVAGDLQRLPPEVAVERLNQRLSTQRAAAVRRAQIAQQAAQAEREIETHGAERRRAIDRLERLCQEAGCSVPAELAGREEASEQLRRLRSEAGDAERELAAIGEGVDLSELERQAKSLEPDRLPGMIDQLRSEIDEELEPQRMVLAAERGRLEKELELMDGGDQAALLADGAAATLAEIRGDAERYIQFRLAARVLRDEIERYRSENQGPLLVRAGEHFSRLTGGSFEGLTTDYDRHDEPVLVGVRPGGAQVAVEGLSSGSRDQLYLALRLASLERYLDGGAAMPLIVDDLLVEFDDPRSAAALECFAALAERTQVILFTHHRRVVTQAQELALPHPAALHTLEPR